MGKLVLCYQYLPAGKDSLPVESTQPAYSLPVRFFQQNCFIQIHGYGIADMRLHGFYTKKKIEIEEHKKKACAF